MVVRNIVEAETENIRRLAKYLKVKMYEHLSREELIEEVRWKLDPWRDQGMYG